MQVLRSYLMAICFVIFTDVLTIHCILLGIYFQFLFPFRVDVSRNDDGKGAVEGWDHDRGELHIYVSVSVSVANFCNQQQRLVL